MTAFRMGVGLELRQVAFGYGRPLLGCVSLSVAPGEVVAVCGPNGSGKSTLLKLAAGLLCAQGGCVLVGEDPMGRLGRIDRAKRMAYLPQNPLLPEGWMSSEVAAMGDYPHAIRPPPPRSLKIRLEEARERLRLSAIWDRPVETLSGGERHLVLLARILVQDAPVLILDEPAADLDLRHQADLFGHLDDMAAEGRAVLLATHDLNLSLLFRHRMVLLDEKGGFSPMPEESEDGRKALERSFGLPLDLVSRENTAVFLPRREPAATGEKQKEKNARGNP